MVSPVVLVGIGQLAGCNGAIRSAVPFRCFASRTFLPRLRRPDLLELCIEISSSPTISIFFIRTSLRVIIADKLLASCIINARDELDVKRKEIRVDVKKALVLISSYRVPGIPKLRRKMFKKIQNQFSLIARKCLKQRYIL